MAPTRLAVIGDVHAHHEHLRIVLAWIGASPVDGVLLVGDIGSNDLGRARVPTPEQRQSYLASVEEVLAAVRALGVPVLWVPGNHDLPDLRGPGCVDRGEVATIGDLRVAGIGGSGPDRFGFPYEWDEAEIRARRVPPCDVLLCHAPPARTALDRLGRSGEHVGSEAIRARAEAHSGVLVCGHIHETPAVERVGTGCLCLNAGGLGRPYGRPQVGLVEGLDRVRHVDLLTGEQRVLER